MRKMCGYLLILIVGACQYSVQPQSVEEESYKKEIYGSSKSKYDELIESIDSISYVAYNDDVYKELEANFNCEECDTLVKSKNSKLAMYAFYKLAFGGCEMKTSEAIMLIEYFEENNSDTIGVWLSPFERGLFLLSEAAANVVWKNKMFPMDPKQKIFIDDIRDGR